MCRSIFASSEVSSSHGLLVVQCSSRAIAPELCSLFFVSHHPPDVKVDNSIPRDLLLVVIVEHAELFVFHRLVLERGAG